MQTKQIVARVRELAQPLCEERGVSLWDVTFEKEGQKHFLTVFIDSEAGVFIEDCEAVSRGLDPLLEAREFDSLPAYTPISVSSIGGFRFTRNRGGERRNLRNVHGIWANRKRNSLELPLTGHREKGIIKENGTACRICPDSGAETEVDHE